MLVTSLNNCLCNTTRQQVTDTEGSSAATLAAEVFVHHAICPFQSGGGLFVGKYQPVTTGQLKNHTKVALSDCYAQCLLLHRKWV